MRAFLIALCLATLAAVGLAAGYLLQQRQRLEQAARAETSAQAATAVSPPAPAPSNSTTTDDPDEDDEEAYMREALAKQTLAANCLVCHEEAMFASQRLTPAQWKSEVDKMISWGAVLPEADREPVEAYLAKRYGAEAPVPAPGRIDLADVKTREIPGDPHAGTADADAAKGGQLYMIICASCHGPTALGTDLGPALANRAVLTHADDYHKQVRDGLRKMPSMSAVLNAEQQRDILGWLRSLPQDQPAATPKP